MISTPQKVKNVSSRNDLYRCHTEIVTAEHDLVKYEYTPCNYDIHAIMNACHDILIWFDSILIMI